MSPEDANNDLYSVSPAAMSDEQIALRDAMTVTAVDQAEKVTAVCGTLHSLLDGLCKSVERLERERDEMRDTIERLLIQIDCNKVNGSPISYGLIQRAEKLLAGG